MGFEPGGRGPLLSPRLQEVPRLSGEERGLIRLASGYAPNQSLPSTLRPPGEGSLPPPITGGHQYGEGTGRSTGGNPELARTIRQTPFPSPSYYNKKKGVPF